MTEIPLRGGTLSEVVRIGDTVRRPSGPWSPAVHALLHHLREQGFDLAPEPMGVDPQGREILSYIEGATVGWRLPWPEWIRSSEMLRQVGRALAHYHRAVSGFALAGAVPWQSNPGPLGNGQIVCHNDLAPYNVVVDAGQLVGIIDWDLAGPGTARSDLAFAAWQWVPLHGPLVTSFLGWADLADRGDLADRARRLRLLLDAYGLDDRGGFLDAVSDRVRYNREVMLTRAEAGDPAYQALVAQGHVAGMDAALDFLAQEGPRLQQQIS